MGRKREVSSEAQPFDRHGERGNISWEALLGMNASWYDDGMVEVHWHHHYWEMGVALTGDTPDIGRSKQRFLAKLAIVSRGRGKYIEDS